MPPPVVPVGGPIEAPAASQMIMVGNAPATTGAGGGATIARPSVPTPVVAAGAAAGEEGATSVTQQPRKRRGKSSDPSKYNRNMTFKPQIRGGVPDFNTMWAEDRLMMAERKRKLRPTEVQPFNLTHSSKETIVRGRSALPAKRFMSSARSGQRCRSLANEVKATRPTSQPAGGDKKIVPKGTRAHAIRTQAVFSKYLSSAEANGACESTREELTALHKGWERQKIVNARLKEYLKGTSVNTDAVIKEKVRALRQRGREMEREAIERLGEMQKRVAQIPPIFVEPTHLYDIATARVETEKEIMRILKDTGVDAGTLTAILSGDSKEAAESGGVTTTIETTNNASDAGVTTAVEPKNEEKSKMEGSSTTRDRGGKRSDSSGSDTQSGSDTGSISSSSNSSETAVHEGKGDYEDDFETSSAFSTASVIKKKNLFTFFFCCLFVVVWLPFVFFPICFFFRLFVCSSSS
ncbi:hypothetical protein TRSC58_03953 [Trypanosoma rangeli SC58]|uniref:Uncharacterized protein n=1 Tax=Trypanosoma rangeli SC58 TaxID=429131 RepID=A0A061J1Z5_TRYRA|nr:hypothetical protein TRSC58_03953 [Trypanosoma rangeli SC58]